MRNKNLVIALTVVVTAVCLFLISFTFIARSVESDAAEYAMEADNSVNIMKKAQYLDSVYDKPVVDLFGFIPMTYKEVKELELSLGLDLQGGMHVVLEVSPIEILKVMAGANAENTTFKTAIKNAKEKQKNSQAPFQELFFNEYRALAGADQLNRIFANSINKGTISARSTDDEIEDIINKEIDESVDRSLSILRNRIDKFGAIQPNLQRIRGTGRILVELPGVENPQRVRNLLQGMAKLEFLEVYNISEVGERIQEMEKYLQSVERARNDARKVLDTVKAAQTSNTSAQDLFVDNSNKKDSTTIAKDSTAADTTQQASAFFRLAKGYFAFDKKDTATINKLLAIPRVQEILGRDFQFMWAKKPYKGVGGDTLEVYELYPVKRKRNGEPALSGDVITDVRYGLAQNGKGYEVSMAMNTPGASEWKKITGEAANRFQATQQPQRIAIALDGYVFSAPTVREQIPNGSSSISGDFTLEEANDLYTVLKAGKLPAPVRIVEEVIVGPTLGAESIQSGLISLLCGIGVVVLLMIMYYNKGGIIADIALIFNVVFTLGFLASMNSVLTLPGIAGIVLTIGMSVDANVLIFERIKEELAAGKSIIQAINAGYDKAFSSIFDSNITTVLTGVILLLLGEGPIKGFALTLIIGVACSFFTAVFISKVIILWMVGSKEEGNVSFTTSLSKNLFRNLNLDIIGKRKIAYVFSLVVLVAGFVSIYMQGGLNLGVDFKGGRSYILEFQNPVSVTEVKDALGTVFTGATEVKTYGSDTKIKATTVHLVEDESTEGDSTVQAMLVQSLSNISKNNSYKILSTSKVGATVADDIKNSSWKSILASLIGIFVYILIRFRKWQFSLGGVVALFHDTMMVLAIFGILRWLDINFEIDQVIIAALLTIVGFSINDTVIVFDRVRELMKEGGSKLTAEEMINTAINSTLSRTIMTTVTVLVSIIILTIFGGEALRGFSVALLIGVIFGSYSTLYIAIPMVLDLRSKEEKAMKNSLVEKKTSL
jgi:SecD/SecF fusion protein